MGIGKSVMRHIVSAACGLWFGLSGIGMAQTASSEPVVVVELYTSQGCSSCPPADAYFTALAQDARVIPLALHVDYWDYIGWADSFADPKFTDRQKAYAHAVGSRTIYTPQMIVGGRDRVEGHQPDLVDELIREQLVAAQSVALVIQRTGDSVHIQAQPVGAIKGPVRVQLVRYRPSEVVMIEHGENAGMKVTYTNIVTSWQLIGEWPGGAPLDMQADVHGDDPVVVILQQDGPAEILAAARVE